MRDSTMQDRFMAWAVVVALALIGGIVLGVWAAETIANVADGVSAVTEAR